MSFLSPSDAIVSVQSPDPTSAYYIVMRRCDRRNSKRNYGSKCNSSSTEVEKFKHLFGDLFLGAKFKNLDPHSCITFQNLIHVTIWCVLSYLHIEKSRTQQQGGHKNCLVRGYRRPTVV